MLRYVATTSSVAKDKTELLTKLWQHLLIARDFAVTPDYATSLSSQNEQEMRSKQWRKDKSDIITGIW